MKNPLLSSPLKSNINNKSEEFADYKTAMLEKLDGIEDLLDYVELGGGMHHHERLAARNKMPVRERIANFLDPDTPFLEISSLAAYASDYPVGGGCVAGIGIVAGTEVVIFANDPTIEGKAHQLGQTNITAKQRFQLRVNELNQVQQNQLNQRIEKDLKREIQATSREQQRQARQSLIESSLVTQLKSLRDTDSELYDRLLDVNIKRFPDLAAKVMDQASLPAE